MYYYLFFSFIAYAFLGWMLEVVYHLYKQRRFINRGFLYGPVCPIYGVTAVLLIIGLVPIGDNIFYVFCGGVIIASIIEFITGFILEKAFNTKWWDYSKVKFNLHGYICLRFSIIWGFISVFFVKVVNPEVSKVVYWTTNHCGEVLYSLLIVALAADSALTINSMIRFSMLLAELQDIMNERKKAMENLVENSINGNTRARIQERISQLGELRQRVHQRISRKQRALLDAYPLMSSARFNSAVEELRKRLNKVKRND